MELLTQDGKTFCSNRNQLVSNYPEKNLFFPHIQPFNEQNFQKIHVSDISEVIQNDLDILHDTFEIENLVFHVDPLFIDYDQT